MYARITSHLRNRRDVQLALLVALLLSGLLWTFAELVDEVSEGEARGFDEKVMLAIHGGPAWLDRVALEVTSLGSGPVLTLFSLAAVGFLLLMRRWRTALLVTVSVAGGALLSAGLKVAFARPRPDLVPHAVEVLSASFPSGHAMLATTTFLTLGAVLAEVQKRWQMQAYLIGWALLLAMLVGLSRIYLGVHWPTDVLAGWCLGSAWALLCGSIALWLKRRGVIARGGPPAHTTSRNTR